MSKTIKDSKLVDASGRFIWINLLLGVVLLLAACGPSSAPVQTAETPVMDSEEAPNIQLDEAAYPSPVEETAAEEAYPVEPIPLPDPTQVPESYPAAAVVFAEPRFHIDLPILAEDKVVNGQAPPNLALAVVDVSSGGILLGSGVSTADGQFTIGVSGLPDGHRVGITFADLQPGKTHADMSREYFPHRGEGFMNIPNVGIFFDSALVGP